MKRWTNKEIEFVLKNYNMNPIDILNAISNQMPEKSLVKHIKTARKRYLKSREELLGY